LKTRIALFVLFAGLMALVLVPSEVHRALAQGPNKFPPTVSKAVKSDHSLPLRKLRATAATARAYPHLPLRKSATSPQVNRPAARDPLLSVLSFATAMPSPIKSFEGISNNDNAAQLQGNPIPPDPNGDIGFDSESGKRFYVQWDNLVFAVWDVTNTPFIAIGPLAGNTLWSGVFSPCGVTNFGDPIALFDPLARRWLLSQFAFTSANPITGPFYQCIAISQTSDPTGSYFRYQFLNSNTNFNDYPKFGVWPDAYYMSTNQFDSGGNFIGGRASAFERDKMLIGDSSARLVSFDLGIVNQNFGGQLPSDFDGLIAPPTGSPNYFVEVDKAGVIDPSHDALGIWQFHVDWTNPANSTFGLDGKPNQVLPVATFNLLPCVFTTVNCVPQPDGAPMLDPIGDRLMYRLQYRNFSDHESLVTNHTVDLGGSLTGHAGIRWYELRKSGSTWNINQQGTVGPDANSRWLGSIAADAQGNIALGYSLSSTTVFPSVMYAGRLATDSPGTLPQAEVALFTGSGSQTDTTGRWGDYSMLAVDPLDDCTFWYTNEYYLATSLRGWHTRIGAFRFPSCVAPPIQPTPSPTPPPPEPFKQFLPLLFR
jgi:hypothetical protein